MEQKIKVEVGQEVKLSKSCVENYIKDVTEEPYAYKHPFTDMVLKGETALVTAIDEIGVVVGDCILRWGEFEVMGEVQQPTACNSIEVGDIIKHDVSGTTYSVVRLGDDRVFITDEGDYILHKDIVVIYKKSWEKPKALEDMSKEELIDLVKQLKGEM